MAETYRQERARYYDRNYTKQEMIELFLDLLQELEGECEE